MRLTRFDYCLAVAIDFFDEFADSTKDSRGPAFVWPDTYIYMVGRFSTTNLGTFKSTRSLELLGQSVAKGILLSNPDVDQVFCDQLEKNTVMERPRIAAAKIVQANWRLRKRLPRIARLAQHLEESQK